MVVRDKYGVRVKGDDKMGHRGVEVQGKCPAHCLNVNGGDKVGRVGGRLLTNGD